MLTPFFFTKPFQLEQLGKTKKAPKIFASAAPVSQSASSGKSEDEEDEDDDFELDKFESAEAYKLKDKIKIKLVLAEIANDTKTRTLRKLAAPVMTAFGKAPTFGMIHSALIVGPNSLIV